MLMIRGRRIQQVLTLVTGVIFLNMSFFLAEISALKLDKNQEMVENIAKLIAGAASEEEKDIFGGESEDAKWSKEVDLLTEIKNHANHSNLLTVDQLHWVTDSAKPTTSIQKILGPPPKI